MDANFRDDHSKLYKHLGAVVRDRRKELSMSQEQLAKESKIDRAFISNIERGLRKPSFGTIASIAEGLKIKYSRLMARCEKRMNQTEKSPTSNLVRIDKHSEIAPQLVQHS